VGAAGGRTSRDCADRHPAARADRPGRRGGHRAVSVLGRDRDLPDRADPAPVPSTPRSTCPAGRVTWPRPGAPSGSASSSPTAARPPEAPAAAGRTAIPSRRGRCCTRSPVAADRTHSSPAGGPGRCRPPGRWSSSASGRRSASPSPGPVSTRSLSSTRPGAASGYGRKARADGEVQDPATRSAPFTSAPRSSRACDRRARCPGTWDDQHAVRLT
jgi:hypothetical protein